MKYTQSRYRQVLHWYWLQQQRFKSGGAPSTLLNDLIAYWNLQETAGTRFDSTDNSNDLDDNNTVGSTTGKIGNAATFEPTNSEYLSSPSSDFDFGLSDFAFSFWFRTSVGNTRFILSKRVSSNGYYIAIGAAGQTTGTLVAAFRTGSTTLFNGGTTLVTDNNWHHVVCNFDRDGNCSLYLDGGTTPELSFDISSQQGLVNPSTSFKVGVFESFYFDGAIDEVGVWTRILTVTEITQLYNAGSGVTYPFV